MQELQFEKVINGNEYTLEIDGSKVRGTCAIDFTDVLYFQSPKKFSKYAYYCVGQSPLGSLLSNKIIVEKGKTYFVCSSSCRHISHFTLNGFCIRVFGIVTFPVGCPLSKSR